MYEEIYITFLITNMLWMFFLLVCYIFDFKLKEVYRGLLYAFSIIAISLLLWEILSELGVF